MYARRLGGKELTFDFAAGLIEDNLLMVDRETGSVWSQLAGKAISGSMENVPLEAVPSIQATWRFWRSEHPGTRVMIFEGEEGDPYVYRAPGRGRPAAGGSHDTSELGLGLSVAGESWFFPLSELDRTATPLTITIGGEMVTLHYQADAFTAWAENAAGDLLVGVLAYRTGWMAFSPDSRLFSAATQER